MGLEDVDEPADQVPQAADGSLAHFAEHSLEPGEGLLDRVEVRAVWRKEAQSCTGCFDSFLHGGPLVAGEVVHDDHIAGAQLGHQDLCDIGFEPVAVDRSVQHHRRNHAGHAQASDQRGGLPPAGSLNHNAAAKGIPGESVRVETALGDNHRAMFPTYSIAKIAAECVVRFAAAAFDLPAIIARMSVPYGDNGGWPYFHLLAMQNGEPIAVHPEKPNYYNPLHVDDYIEKVPYLLGATSLNAITTNLGGSQIVALEEWCAHIGQRTGLVPIFKEQTSAFGSLAIDTTLMHSLIGETKVDWRDGIDRMLERFPFILVHSHRI